MFTTSNSTDERDAHVTGDEYANGMHVTKKLTDAELQERLPLSLDVLRDVLRRNHIARAWLFGSRSRGTHRPDSDIDILYEPAEEDLSPLGYGRLLNELDRSCPVPVDVAEELHEGMKPYIADDLVRVL